MDESGPEDLRAAYDRAAAHRRAGRVGVAEAICREILAAAPDHAEAHNLLGGIRLDQGRAEEAAASFRQALAARPDHAFAAMNLGLALNRQGLHDEAIESYRRALALNPNLAEAHNNLGAALLRRGEAAGAIECCGRALALRPDNAAAHHNLGLARRQQGRSDDALASFRRALAAAPAMAEAQHQLGTLLQEQGKLDEAVAALRVAVELRPDWHVAHNDLGIALMAAGWLDEAVASCRRALALRPDFARAQNNLGNALRAQGRLSEATECYRRAVVLRPDLAVAHANLASALTAEQRLEEALGHYRTALSLRPSADTHANLAVTLERAHRLDEAREAAASALALDPHNPLAAFVAAKAELRDGDAGAARARLAGLVARHGDAGERSVLRLVGMACQELGLLDERAGQYDEAMRSFAAASEMYARCDRDLAEKTAAYRDLIRRLTELIASRPEAPATARAADPGFAEAGDARSPIFLLGFGRSGTTLLQQVLSSHPRIACIDEKPLVALAAEEMRRRGHRYPDSLFDLSEAELEGARQVYWSLARRYVEPERSDRIVLDKEPQNTVHLGLIHRLFPTARIVVAIRDPRDVCLSCFARLVKEGARMGNFLTLESTAALYDLVMGLWLEYRRRLPLAHLEMRYEDLVASPERETRRLARFLDLEWDDAMLDPAAGARGRLVNSASYDQVVRPIHGDSIGRWSHYRKHFESVLPVLRPYLDAFGYGTD